MAITTIILVVGLVLALVAVVATSYVFLGGQDRAGEIRGLMGGAGAGAVTARPGKRSVDVDDIKRFSQSSVAVKKTRQEDITAKLFQAGYYTENDRRNFRVFQISSFIVAPVVCMTLMFFLMGTGLMTTAGLLLGLFIGFALPMSWLERKVRQRQELILYYLPLVVEQIAIGVSSSLDIGPCISQIVTMARERDSHNPLTEMFAHVEKLIRSGLSLDDALVEVADAHNMTELKHAFTFLAQCAKHGGEVSRQLQELGDAVMVQRQVQVEGRIAALPVKATLPLFMVFAGFFIMIGSGLFVKLLSAFDMF